MEDMKEQGAQETDQPQVMPKSHSPWGLSPQRPLWTFLMSKKFNHKSNRKDSSPLNILVVGKTGVILIHDAPQHPVGISQA